MHDRFRQIWAWPLFLGVLLASGLFSALVSDQWGDLWSWVGLGVPVCVMTVLALKRGGA